MEKCLTMGKQTAPDIFSPPDGQRKGEWMNYKNWIPHWQYGGNQFCFPVDTQGTEAKNSHGLCLSSIWMAAF